MSSSKTSDYPSIFMEGQIGVKDIGEFEIANIIGDVNKKFQQFWKSPKILATLQIIGKNVNNCLLQIQNSSSKKSMKHKNC